MVSTIVPSCSLFIGMFGVVNAGAAGQEEGGRGDTKNIAQPRIEAPASRSQNS
jgi:hypothetical protein